MTLCNLEDVKTLLGITDNSADAKLTLMIKAVSSQIQSYLGYELAMADYTEELHSVNNRQLLQLNALPLRSVTSVTVNGAEIDDYKVIPFLEDNNNHNVVMNIGYIIKKGEVFNNIEKIYINEVKRILDNNIVGIHNEERKQGA